MFNFLKKLVAGLKSFKRHLRCLFFFFLKDIGFFDFFFKKKNFFSKNYTFVFNDYTFIYNNSFFLKNFIKSSNFFDYFWSFFFSNKYKNKFNKVNLFRSYFRILKTNQGFYFNFSNLKNNVNLLNFLKNFNFFGYFYLWNAIRFWVIPLFLLFVVVYLIIFLKSIPFNKIIFSWIAILMFSYWLLSGFVFFFKKYQFSKYTSVIQRFWRRTYILFWLIEGSTFLVFLFFTINASQESFYMFDQISIFKSHLYSWKLFLLKLFPVVFLIIFSYLLLLSLKWNLFSKHTIWLFFITFFLTYLVWLEFYQFFHVINFYCNLNWIYDLDDHSWFLELEPRRTRMVNHYVMILFILKFWHIVFIYGFWLFFVLRCLETKRIRYPLLSANFQNFIILYIFTWVFMYPWFKFFFRKFLDLPYYWFYINNRKQSFRVFFYDFKLIYYGFIADLDVSYRNLNKFMHYNFFYFKTSDYSNNFEFFKKNFIKNKIIISLNNS